MELGRAKGPIRRGRAALHCRGVRRRLRRAVWVGFAAALSGACRTSGSARDDAPARVEFLALRRNASSGLERTDDDQSLFGANYVHPFEGGWSALELGLRAGEFERVDGSETDYVETHAGARLYALAPDVAVRPYLGLGLLWNGRGSARDLYSDDERNRDDDAYDLLAWIVRQSGPYVTLGVDASFGRLYVGAGLRAVCAEGVDLSALNSDDFALDLFVTLGFGL